MTLALVKQPFPEYTKPAKVEGLLPVIDLPTVTGSFLYGNRRGAGAKAEATRKHPQPQLRSFSGRSFARTECEQTFANATKFAEFSRIVRLRASFATISLPKPCETAQAAHLQ